MSFLLRIYFQTGCTLNAKVAIPYPPNEPASKTMVRGRKRKLSDNSSLPKTPIWPPVSEGARGEYHKSQYPSTFSAVEDAPKDQEQNLQLRKTDSQSSKIATFRKLKKHIREVVTEQLNGKLEEDSFWRKERPGYTWDVFPSNEEIGHLVQETLDDILNRVR